MLNNKLEMFPSAIYNVTQYDYFLYNLHVSIIIMYV
jgi:hypothetical protein